MGFSLLTSDLEHLTDIMCPPLAQVFSVLNYFEIEFQDKNNLGNQIVLK